MAIEVLTVVVLLVSLAVLAKASEYAIIYASAIARLAGVSDLAIGFLLVAVSTSLPELVVSVTSALSGAPQLGVGNVFGANISDVTLVLGAAAITAGITIPRKEHSQLAHILLAVSAMSMVMVLGNLSRLLGFALLGVFCLYAYFVLKTPVKFADGLAAAKEKKPRQKSVQDALRGIAFSSSELVKSLLLFSACMAAILFSAKFAVETAVDFAANAGIGLAVIGSTLVSLGTTLPELSVSIAAARVNKNELALGNAIGSCITNIALILGLAITINPRAADLSPHLGLIAYSIFTYLLLVFFLDYRKKFGRLEGAILLLAYLLFLLAQTNVIQL